MRVAPILVALVAAGCALVDAHIGQPMLRSLSVTTEGENETLPLRLLAGDPGTCSWGSGLQCSLAKVTNDVKLGDAECDLPIPILSDNYVADKRRNKNDGADGKVASNKPFVQVTATSRQSGSITSTGMITWYRYLTDPAAVLSQIHFNMPGLYDLSFTATDYDHTASCGGCVALFDDFQPQFKTGSCPIVPSSPQALTSSSLSLFKTYEEDYEAYVNEENVLNNLNSGDDCSAIVSKWKTFHVAEEDLDGSCYTTSFQSSNLAKLKLNPFSADLQSDSDALEASLNSECTWCCNKAKTLQEMRVQFDCATNTPTTSCTAGAECAIDLCLYAKGDDIANAHVTINADVQKASEGVIAALPSVPVDSDAEKHIYYSIPCSDFDDSDPSCQYNVKLSELLDVSTEFVEAFPTPEAEATQIDDYIFWRYNLDGGSWVTWNPSSDETITFADASTTVLIEAWTMCGRIESPISFDVNLYVHSQLSCAKFDTMWTPVDVLPDSTGAYCSYTGSDFTIMKLDMSVADILEEDGAVSGTFTGVECDIMVKETGESVPDTSFASLVPHTTATTVEKYFAVDLVNDPTTSQKTTANVKCRFTRTARSSGLVLAAAATAPLSIECSHTFTLTDCEPPRLNEDLEFQVCSHTCANKSAPGMHEACGGAIVTSSAVTTTVTETDQACCADCAPWLQCSILESTDVKRCELPVCLEGPHSVATPTLAIKESVQATSIAVLNALPALPADSDAAQNVYASVPCTDLDENDCQYIAKLSDLLDGMAGVAEGVFWRYNLDGGSWSAWNPSQESAVAFSHARTSVNIEAWTACEQVGDAFSFDVQLFVHSALTCNTFDAMWTAPHSVQEDGAYCAYEGSDFTIMDMAIVVSEVLPHSAATVKGTYTGVECEVMVKEDGAGDTAFATLVKDTTSTTISKSFGVELVHDPHTAEKTAAQVKCTFTRTAHGSSLMLAAEAGPHAITCTHDFFLTDCDGPELHTNGQVDVCADSCAGKPDPGMNEQCGGTVVTSTEDATVVSTGSKTCCADCEPDLECTTVANTDIERCEIPVASLMLAQFTAAEQPSERPMLLLGAIALIAVVVLVAIKRRVGGDSARTMESEDAYYSLLEVE
jgi:hypothetical protein